MQAAVKAAGDIAAFYAARITVPCTASTLLVISADAKGLQIINTPYWSLAG
jgi:hypothetical protein